MASGRFADYIGRGLAAARDATPTLFTESFGLYYATDTAELSLWDGTVWWEDIVAASTATGDVVGPVSSTDSHVVLFDGVTGKLLKGGGALGTAAFTASSAYDASGAAAAAQAAAIAASQPVDADLTAIAALTPANDDFIQRKAGAWTFRTVAQVKADLAVEVPIIVAPSDETTALTTGTAKLTFRMPYAFTLTGVRASVNTAPTGSVLTVDINEGGVSILSTKLTIDATEKTSTTAAVPAVIADAALADDAEITIDIDTVGSTVAGAGLKVTLLGYKT